jgi:[ribosomal protein S5]-alanine N-acetyltransferase
MLIGKNVSLRPITLADQKLLLDWCNDPGYIGLYDNHWTNSLEQLEKQYQESVQHGASLYMITSRDGGEPMGELGYANRFSIPDFQAQEIFYIVHPRYRGQGVASQAACVLVNHLFDATPINRIQATVAVGNENSCKVLENAGMQHEGILRGLLFLHGRYVDLHMYGIVRADWCDEPTYRKMRREF